MKIVCITLPEQPQREARARQHFSERGVDASFFYGIHGENFGLRTIHNYEVDHPGSGFNIGPKLVGLWLSHYALWAGLMLLPDHSFLVLEDDAIFVPDWKARLDQARRDMPPDFDVCYVGSCCTKDKPKKHIKGDVYAISEAFCTHGILYNRKALPTLIKTQRKIMEPIDISLCFHTLGKLNTFAILPRLLDQFETNIQP